MGSFPRLAGGLLGAAVATHGLTAVAQDCTQVTVNISDINMHPLKHLVSIRPTTKGQPRSWNNAVGR